MDIYYIDGEFVPADEAVIPVNDLAVIRGYGVFDFLRTYGGKPFFLKEHIERLEQSARQIDLDFPWSHSKLAAVVMQTLNRNNYSEANIRLLVLVTPAQKLPEWWYENGVKIITTFAERFIPGAKSINYIPATIALKKARKQNAVEAVYIDRDGFVQEGTTSNLFAFIGDKLVTPGREILAGITRHVVLTLAEGMFDTEIRDIKKDELLKADEVFVTGTNKGLVPVVQVDDTIIGDGKPGARTRQVMETLAEYNARYITSL
jgi:branched-chain amino acid aminotransferase